MIKSRIGKIALCLQLSCDVGKYGSSPKGERNFAPGPIFSQILTKLLKNEVGRHFLIGKKNPAVRRAQTVRNLLLLNEGSILTHGSNIDFFVFF